MMWRHGVLRTSGGIPPGRDGENWRPFSRPPRLRLPESTVNRTCQLAGRPSAVGRAGGPAVTELQCSQRNPGEFREGGLEAWRLGGGRSSVVRAVGRRRNRRWLGRMLKVGGWRRGGRGRDRCPGCPRHGRGRDRRREFRSFSQSLRYGLDPEHTCFMLRKITKRRRMAVGWEHVSGQPHECAGMTGSVANQACKWGVPRYAGELNSPKSVNCLGAVAAA
jgi:hypothetical protein